MDNLFALQEQAERLSEEIALRDAMRDRKVEAQRKEIVRQCTEIKALKAEIKQLEEGESGKAWFQEKQHMSATISIQRKAIQDRQDYIDEVKRKLRGLASDGDKFQ